MATNFKAEFEKLTTSLPQIKQRFDEVKKSLEKAKVAKIDSEIDTANKLLAETRLPLQCFITLKWIFAVYDHEVGTVMLNDEHVEENFSKHFGMLQGLSTAQNNPGADFIKTNFGGLITKLLEEEKHPLFKYRVVWFALTLGDFYRNERAIRYTPGHWEDEADLHEQAKIFIKAKYPTLAIGA